MPCSIRHASRQVTPHTRGKKTRLKQCCSRQTLSRLVFCDGASLLVCEPSTRRQKCGEPSTCRRKCGEPSTCCQKSGRLNPERSLRNEKYDSRVAGPCSSGGVNADARGGAAQGGLLAAVPPAAALAHKTFHRYVVRAKAGGRQSTKDAGGGKTIKSAGSSIRRRGLATMRTR